MWNKLEKKYIYRLYATDYIQEHWKSASREKRRQMVNYL